MVMSEIITGGSWRKSTRNSVYFATSCESYYYFLIVCKFFNSFHGEGLCPPLSPGWLCSHSQNTVGGMLCHISVSSLKNSEASLLGSCHILSGSPEPPPCMKSDAPAAAMWRGHVQAFQSVIPDEAGLPSIPATSPVTAALDPPDQPVLQLIKTE